MENLIGKANAGHLNSYYYYAGGIITPAVCHAIE